MAESTLICGDCNEECTDEEDLWNQKTEAHDDAHDGAENDVPDNQLQDEAEFL